MVTAAIVLYHNEEKVLSDAINSFLNSPIQKHLFLIDNSKDDNLKKFAGSEEISYINTGKNLGFGGGHNAIMDRLKESSHFHLILNPDAYFASDVLPLLVEQLKIRESVGLIAPKILYPNGNFQKSIRRFPKFFDLLVRRVPGMNRLFRKAFERGNYLNQNLDDPLEVDAVSGCFQLYRTETFLRIKGFDERFFMYMEDLDICRRVHEMGDKILYYPSVEVYHRSEYGSKKSMKLLWAHIKSMIQYFLKWNFN